MKMKIIPAILSADKKDFLDKLAKITNLGLIHIDVCDGKFVGSKTLQPVDFENVKLLKAEFHLMVKDIDHYVEHLAHFAPEMIIFHFEACKNSVEVLRFIRHIKSHNVNVGLAINPETSVAEIKKFLKSVDQIIVMTVHPGLQGQKFIHQMLDKVSLLRKFGKNLNIAVDGSMNEDTILLAKNAGANLFVVGSAIVKSNSPKKEFDKLAGLIE